MNMMKKKLMKMTKIFLVLTLIFSQLSSVTKVFADEITGNDTEIKDETKELVVNGYLMNTFDDSIIDETENDGVFEYNVTAGKYRQILTISGDKIDDTKSYSVKVNDNDSVVLPLLPFMNSHTWRICSPVLFPLLSELPTDTDC